MILRRISTQTCSHSNHS